MRHISIPPHVPYPEEENSNMEDADADPDQRPVDGEWSAVPRCPICRSPLVAVMSCHGPQWRCLCRMSAWE